MTIYVERWRMKSVNRNINEEIEKKRGKDVRYIKTKKK
jgi:hypothetical protein